MKSLQRQLIEVKREKESEIQVSQVYLQYTPQMYIHTITFKTNEIYLINIKLNKTLQSVHFGVVVVELINCKCAGIVRNQIW